MGKYYRQHKALMNKAVDLVWAIVLRDIEPREGCRQIGEICESLGWPDELVDLGAIAPELQRLEDNGLPTETCIDDIMKQAEKLFDKYSSEGVGQVPEKLFGIAISIARRILDGKIEPQKGCKLIGGICSQLIWPDELMEFGHLEELQWEKWPETQKPRSWNKTIMEEARKLVEWYETKRRFGKKP